MKIGNGLCLFWREFPSNWKISPFNIGGIVYNCVEQYMMSEKARVCGDEESFRKILEAKLPADQKRLGRNVTPYDAKKWESVRYDVVLMATIEKYRQNPELKDLLLKIPHDVVFVEASPKDSIWGIGIDEDHPDAFDPKKWAGQNLLGKAITEARQIFVPDARGYDIVTS